MKIIPPRKFQRIRYVECFDQCTWFLIEAWGLLAGQQLRCDCTSGSSLQRAQLVGASFPGLPGSFGGHAKCNQVNRFTCLVAKWSREALWWGWPIDWCTIMAAPSVSCRCLLCTIDFVEGKRTAGSWLFDQLSLCSELRVRSLSIQKKHLCLQVQVLPL